MKLTRIPSGLSQQDRAIFYASKLAVINRELSKLSLYWESCTMRPINRPDSYGIETYGPTCLQAGLTLCKACKNNEQVYKEKRKLKSQFSKALSELCLSPPIEGPICKKEEPSFTDLNEFEFQEDQF